MPHGRLQLPVEPPVLGGHLHLRGFGFSSFTCQKEQLSGSLDLQLSAETRNWSSGFLRDSCHLTQPLVSEMATCTARQTPNQLTVAPLNAADEPS